MRPSIALRPPAVVARVFAAAVFASIPPCGAAPDEPRAAPPPQGPVGELGSISRLVMEGNTTITETALRRALARDVEVIRASHPLADLAGLPPVIAGRLGEGYRNSGFPAAKVAVAVAGAGDDRHLVVRVTEGPRYRMGRIRIEGANDIPADQLRALLLDEPGDPSPATVLAESVQEALAKHQALLPQPDPADGDAAQSLGGLFSDSASSGEADWTPGEPVQFGEPDEEPLADRIRCHLATLGRPLTRFHSALDMQHDGTADLVIRLVWEGPAVVVDGFRVLGASANTAEEIIAATGLKPGQPLLPGVLDAARLALWDTGRFFPFAITPLARVGNDAEIDLLIQVCEISGVPALRDPIPPHLDAAMRFIHTINHWIASTGGDDLLVTIHHDHGQLTVGISGRDGLVFDFQLAQEDTRGTVCLGREQVLVKVRNSGRDSVLKLPLPAERMIAGLRLLPDPAVATGKRMSFDFYFGASSSLNLRGRPLVRLLVSPALPLLKPDSFRVADERFVDFFYDDRPLVRFEAATARLVATADTAVEYRTGGVREFREKITADAGQPDPLGGLADWIASAKTALELLAQTKADAAADPDFAAARKWLDFAALLATPEITRPFADLWDKWTAAPPEEETFSIPVNPVAVDERGLFNLLVGLGAATLGELLAPPDSWVSKFTREIVFLQGGDHRHTDRVMRELLDDPGMGPYGSVLAGRVMRWFDPTMASRFFHKARATATAEGFHEDWLLLLASPLGLDRAMREALAALAAAPQARDAEITAALEPREADWLSDFLTRLRARPADVDLAVWLTPQMDQLWDQHLRAPFLESVERQLNPPADAKLVAALVNGRALRRDWVAQVEDAGIDHYLLPRLEPDPARPWTRHPALAEFVRLMLWPKPQDGAAQAANAPFDTQQIGADLRQFAAAIARPDNGELEGWWQTHGPDLGRQAHLHSFRTTVAGERPEDQHRATTLVRAAAALVRDGLPFVTLTIAARKDQNCEMTLDCTQDALLVDMRPEFYQCLRRLQPGDSSGIVGVGNIRWTASLVAWQPAPPPALAKVRDQAIQAWAYDQYLQSVRNKLAPAEESAEIRLFDDPGPLADDQEFFPGLLKANPDSPVALLAVCWQKARANAADAGDALAALLATKTLDAAALKPLAKALADLGRQDLADRCAANL